MGVKDLWVIAGPCEERISLHDLRNENKMIIKIFYISKLCSWLDFVDNLNLSKLK